MADTRLAQKLFERAAQLQTEYWDAVRDLELELESLGLYPDVDSSVDFAGYDSVEEFAKAQEDN